MKINKKLIFFCVLVFSLAFFYRYKNLNTTFWVDEFSSAIQSKIIFSDSSLSLEKNNFFHHFLLSKSFDFFGESVQSARYPSLIFGSLVPVLIFLLSKKLFEKNSAFTATFLGLASYFQITWSRQARGYVIQQFLLLLSIYLYWDLLKKFSKTKFAFLFISLILGLLTHTSFILLIGSIALHFLFFHWKSLKKTITKPLYLLLVPIFLGLTFFSGQLNLIINFVKNLLLNPSNNLSYYHSFLWREQTIITLFAFLGSLLLIFKDKKYKLTSLLLLPVGAYLFFVSFMFAPYVSRYLLPIFPLLIILAGVAISKFGELISKKWALLWTLIITFFIIFNGDKFVLKPRAFYSANHDMREIALINYDQVYQIIKEKGQLNKGQTAVIDTWSDRTRWYLGGNQEYFYNFRWIDSEGLVNGLEKRTSFEINKHGEKYIPNSGTPAVKFIGELSDLQLAMQKYPQGFIWIDDTSLPADVIEYVQQNFTKELYLDHYPLDDNPYSIWPGTLYSWGFESN